MPDIDPRIPLGVQSPFSSLGSMLDMAKSVQTVRAGQIANESNQKILEERNNVRKLFQNPQALLDETGNLDFNKVAPMIMEAAPTQGGQIITSLITAQRDSVAAKNALLKLNDDQRASAGQFVMALGGDSPEVAFAKMDEVKKLNPQLAAPLDYARKYFLENAAKAGPDAWKKATLQIGQMAMGPDTQRAAMTDTGIQVDNGQQSSVVATNPMGPTPPGQPIPGTVQQKQLPPTTPTFNPETQAPGYLGPQPSPTQVSPAVQAGRDDKRLQILRSERAQEEANPDVAARTKNLAAIDKEIAAMTPTPRKPLQSGPALGVVHNVEGTVEAVNKDWNATIDMARNAAQDIGVLQNMKKYASDANVGIGQARRAWISGLAGYLGVPEAELIKTNTDLLAKNTNMLALAGGDTNLAKLMAESANPNKEMTKEAIVDAANQIIAQRKLVLAKQGYMAQFKGDAQKYSEELAKFNKAADPRILQLRDMTVEEKAKMKAAMTPSERAEFGRKIREMESMGIVQ